MARKGKNKSSENNNCASASERNDGDNSRNCKSGVENTNFSNRSRGRLWRARRYSNKSNHDGRYNRGRFDENRQREYDDKNNLEAHDNINRSANSTEGNFDTNEVNDNRNNNFWRYRRWGHSNYKNRDDNSWENPYRNSENAFRYERNDSYKIEPVRNDRKNIEHGDYKDQNFPSESEHPKLKQQSLDYQNYKNEIDGLQPRFEEKLNKTVFNNSPEVLKTNSTKGVEDEFLKNNLNEKQVNENILPSTTIKEDANLEVKKKVTKPVLPLPAVKIKKEPHSNSDKSDSSSSFDSETSSTSSNDNKKSPTKNKRNDDLSSKAKTKGKINTEEEIVYMGKLKNFQNLVDEDESSNECKKNCILCEKSDHTSFQCFMECKNCGEKYHNLKMCPKPANLSVMLQNFMEFCLQQCYQYNPEQKFTFIRDNLATELIPGLNQARLLIDNVSNSGSNFKNNSKRRRKNKEHENINEYESNSESSSSSANFSKVKKKKKKEQMQYPLPFFPITPQSFNPLAAAAMMGFNPAVFMGKKEK